MQYLLDTVTLVRHFTGKGKLGRQAAHILKEFEQNNDSLVVSVISLMEVMYLSEKHRIEIDLAGTLTLLRSSSKYIIVDLNPDILEIAEKIVFDELHDRLILATAAWLGIKIISSDNKFGAVAGIEVIWS